MVPRVGYCARTLHAALHRLGDDRTSVKRVVIVFALLLDTSYLGLLVITNLLLPALNLVVEVLDGIAERHILGREYHRIGWTNQARSAFRDIRPVPSDSFVTPCLVIVS